MATLLHMIAIRHRKITVDIFLLANNYHSILGSDMESGNVKCLTEKVQSDWEKINKRIISNGHSSRGLSSVTSLEDAEAVAYLALYTDSYIRKKYLL